MKARRFLLMRDVDVTGTSGTGEVAEGVMFRSGQVALTWLSPYTSVAVYANMEVVEHLHGHGGNTRIVWIDQAPAHAILPSLPTPAKRLSR